MKKNKYYQYDNDSNDDTIEQESEPVLVKKEEKKIIIEEPLYAFEQAMRIFKKQNPHCVNWNEDSVKIFASKKLRGKKHKLSDWFLVFNKY